MAELSPIFGARIDDRKIGYIGGTEAFDLLGNKRCDYNPSTGNLLDLGNGRTIGHVSLAGYFVGLSWIAAELFPQSGAVNSPTSSPHNPTGPDSAGFVTSLDKVVTVECIELVISPDETVAPDPTASVTSADTAMTVEAAFVTSTDQPIMTDQIASATSLGEADAADFTSRTASSDEPTAIAPAMSFEALSQESAEVEPAVLLPTSIKDTSAADYPACAPVRDETPAAHQTETHLSIDVDRQVREMIQMTLTMKSFEPKSQTVKAVAMQMREHLSGLRRRSSHARMVKKAELMRIREGQARD
jgi:hypothetical protein